MRRGKSRRAFAIGCVGAQVGTHMAKKPPERAIHTWTVHRMKKKAERIGTVEAATEEEAIDRAVADFQIRDVDRFRISVRRS